MSDERFRDFVALRYTELLRTAYLLSGGQQAAEDLLQTVLLSAMRRWHRIDDPMAYLRRAMVNQRTSGWRRAGRLGEWLTAVVPERAAAADPIDRFAQRDELLVALATLPTRMRAVLVLRYWEDLSEIQTAEVLGCSVGSVKSQASRGLTRLRGVLRPDVAVTRGRE